MPFAETSRLFVLAIHPDSIAIAASLPILKPAAETTSLPIKESAVKLGRCRFLYRQRRLHRCQSRIGSGNWVVADFCIGSEYCVAADPESAAELRCCRFLYRQQKLGRCRFLYRQRILCRCRSRIDSGTASLPILNRQRNHPFLTRPSIRTPLAKANHSLSRPSIRMALAEANHSFVPAFHSDAISRS